MRLSALLVLLAATAAVAGTPVVVEIPPTAEVTGVVYRLGDVATVTCEDAVLAERLRGVVIARTPPPGRHVRISRRVIGSILAPHAAGDVRLEGASAVSVRARIVRYDAEAIREAGRRFLESKLADLAHRNVTCPATEVVSPMSVPAGRETTSLVASYADVPRSRGAIRVAVRAVADGVPLDARVVRYRVQARERVLVLVRDVRSGERIGAADVEARLVDVSDQKGGLVTSLDDLRKAVCRRGLPAGTTLTERHLRRLPDVQSGDLVEVVYRRGALVVRSQGRALQDGRRGNAVVVENSASGRRLQGRVAGPGIVEVGPEPTGGNR